MGEVLENGVYLPDEGERNAYNGLKDNWNTVDTVVAQVQALSSAGLIRKAVDELPTEDIETNVIYMLKAVKPDSTVYRIEYMYIDNHWDALGTSETTLDDYYTKAETDDLPAVKSGVNATKVSNYDAHLANNDIHVTLANKQSWDGKQNALDTAQTAAVNSGVTAAKVTGYDAHVSDTGIHVTTSDKTAWNGKQDGLSQTQLAAVNSGITEAKITGYDNHVADTNVHVTTADKTAWNGKQNALTQTQLDNIAAVPDKANSADLATVATTGDYGDLLNAPTIPTVNNATLTIQKNGTDVATFTANASSNVTANLAIPVNTSDLNNDAGFLTQHNPIDNALSATSENALQNKVVKSELDGKAPLVHTHAAGDVTSGTFNIARIPNLDASKITSGTIDIARLPKGSLERLVKVANQAARYALTADDVQLGDTVQQLDTGVMYVVTDETKLDSADGYTEFTAGSASSVPWTGVTGKPNDYPPSSHTHTKSQITDFPVLATVATSGSYNDLNNIPASFTPSSHTHGNLTNDGKIGTIANVPLITGTDGTVTAGSFGNSANTFCEGNDSRLSDARTPLSHTHGSITNDGKLDTASRALVTDANKNIAVSSVTATELGYVSGVTSAIQTQIAGKAPLAHTHTKSDITDFPVYGTTAGTICEGNDSRLSDARTPLSHTHGSITNDGKLDTASRALVTDANKNIAVSSVTATELGYVSGVTSAIQTQIAGKAPLVHTHTKSDITDLFDSANVWSGDNTFSKYINYKSSYTLGNLPAGATAQSAFRILDSTGTDFICDINSFQNTLATGLRFTTRNKMDANGFSPSGTIKAAYLHFLQNAENKGYLQWDGYTKNSINPLVNNTYDLGSSSYQWNNLYAKGYYYNGVAWGLDKINTWSAQQIFVGNNSRGSISMYNPAYTKGGTLSSTDLSIGTIYMGDGGQQGLANSLVFISTDLAANGAKTLLSLSAMENTASSGTRTNVVIQYDKNDTENPKKVAIGGDAIPNPDATFSLGTPTFRWKTLNGVNPGALSLPDLSSNNVDPINTATWDVTGQPFSNTYKPDFDGWLCINIKDTATNSIFVFKSGGYAASAYGNGSQNTDGRLAVMIPVLAGQTYGIIIKAGSNSEIFYAKFIPNKGNV